MSEQNEQSPVVPQAAPGPAVVQQPLKAYTGRTKIMTNYLSESQKRKNMCGYEILNKDNIVQALNDALTVHRQNSIEIHELFEYYKGNQAILGRVKDIRGDVNNRIVINYANTFTRDIVGYTFGKPMTYSAAESDKDNDNGDTIKKEIRLLNRYAKIANKQKHDQEKAIDCSVCGVSYRGIFYNEDDENESPYKYIHLDCENTFVAHNSQLSGEVAFACTYIDSTNDIDPDGYTLYTVYTKDEVYLFKSPHRSNFTIDPADLVQGYPQENPLGMIPIIECENNQFRMGHWEMAISLMDAINKVASDSVNDIEQFVSAIMVAINAEFTKDTMDDVKRNKFAQITSAQGLPADLKYIQAQLDGQSVEQTRQYLEDCLRAVVGIPDRKTRGGGGGDTGDAVKLRDGWADMEVVARTTETFNKASEREELKIILKILKVLKKISKTSIIDIDIDMPRNKTDNLNNKVNAFSTLMSTQIMAPEDALDIVDIISDVAEVVARGEVYWKKKKEENFEEQQRQLELQGVDGTTQEGGNVNAKSNNRTDSGKQPTKSNTNSNTGSKQSNNS